MADDRIVVDIAELVAEHHAAVYRYAYRLIGTETEAEDLSQQCFLVAQQRLAQLRRREAARSWLFAIVRSLFLRLCRQRRPISAASLEMDLQSVAAEPAEEPSIDSETLQGALDGLSPVLRLAITMYYFEGASYRQIAEELDLPMGTVMSRLARAKRALRAMLTPSDTFPIPSPSPNGPHRVPHDVKGDAKVRE